MNDTGLNVPETAETLRAQQRQLVEGRRLAQMFPLNSRELPLPAGFERVETDRGAFHFNPALVSRDEVFQLSKAKRENIMLGLGPYNKADVMRLFCRGEPLLVVTERTPDGIEVKAAIGTHSTLQVQMFALENMKTPGNVIATERPEWVLSYRLQNRAGRISHG